jgi:hypothetical protein
MSKDHAGEAGVIRWFKKEKTMGLGSLYDYILLLSMTEEASRNDMDLKSLALACRDCGILV